MNMLRCSVKQSKDLRPLLKRKLKDEWIKQLGGIIGYKNRTAFKIKKGKIKKTGKRPLKRLFPSGKMIYAKYKGVEFKAWVYQNGRIKYQESRYDSPSMAAKAIIDRGAVNGWRFWKYKDEAGNMVPIDNLRK